MGYFEKYRNRAGKSIGDRMREHTENKVQSQLVNSPNYKQVLIGGTWHDVRLVQGIRVGSLEILFAPHQDVPIGSIVEFDGETWLITEISHQITIVKKGVMYKCNNTLQWKKANIPYSLPAYITQYYTLGVYDIEAKTGIDYDTAKGGLFAYVQNNAISKTIILGDKFSINGQAFEVVGIDNISHIVNNVGYIKLTIMRTINDGTTIVDNTNNKVTNGGGLW
jgi:hypothetical protein